MPPQQQRFRCEEQRVDFVEIEERVLEWWKKEGIFERSVERRRSERRPRFVFVEGPPTANGLPHPGHIFTRAVKDAVLRFKTMQGFLVERKAGWDTHGLPVEIEVEKELGINSKREIEAFGIENFNRKCKSSVFKYEREWVKATERVGFWIDMEHPYVTFHNSYIESVWWSLKEIWKKGLLYKGHKVVPYCPRCGTPLSSHEVAQGYKDVEDPSVFVRFKLRGEDAAMLAWTTTPWTLFGNVALAVHPEHTYVRVRIRGVSGGNSEESGSGSGAAASESGGEIREADEESGVFVKEGEELILAEARLCELDAVGCEYEILERFKGAELEGKEYERLFEYARVEGGDAFKVVTAEFVTLDEGTGVVHIAPAFGAEDYEVAREKHLGFCQPVDARGCFTAEVEPFAGKFVKDADGEIIEMLRERGSLFKAGKYRHKYPFCWRCGSPLIYYARASWFIRMRALREDLLRNNESVRWVPAHLKHGRFGNFIENVEDWALSRERFWGTPLNIWICERCGREECIGSISELKEKAVRMPTGELDLHRPFIDGVVLRCECGGEMRRVPDVIDCWYDSGSAPFAQWHYPFENEEKFRENFPADFITEAIDQTRGWFYSLLAVSTAVFNTAPYKTVLSLGHILDEKGEKMSKSKGNVVDIQRIFSKYGADALRWYFFTAGPPYEDLRFSEKAIAERQRKFLNTLWNSYFFFITYATIDNFVPERKEIPVNERAEIDRWIISRLNSLISDVRKHFEAFEFHLATRKIEEFVIEELSNWYIRRSRRRFWVEGESKDKDAAYLTLYEVLLTLCKLLAPFIPFLTEHIFQNLRAESDELSVHLCDYPACNEALVDKDLEVAMLFAMRIAEAGRRARSEAGIKMRQPLRELVVACTEKAREKIERFSAVICDELNVKEMRFVALTADVEKEFPADKFKRVDLECEGEKISLFLNISLDKELVQEGLVKDIVRRIQEMRKQLDLPYTAKIRVSFAGDAEVREAISAFRKYICEETLAEGIYEASQAEEAERKREKRGGERLSKEWRIGKKTVLLQIEVLK